MHDVVRDVARWIASTFGDEHTSVFQAGIGLNEISHIKISASVTKISFASNKIECLPDCFTKCPKTTSLLLQDNQPLKKIPQEFFWACPALRVLNLSLTSITKLPSSLNSLCQLRALILQSCFELKELPCFANLHNLQMLDCDHTMLHFLPQGMDNLINLRLLNLYLNKCMGLRKLIAYSTFNGLKSLNIQGCYCAFGPVEGGSGQFDPLPNLEYLDLYLLVELYVQCSSSDQATLVNSEIPRVCKLKLYRLPDLGTLGEPQGMWEHLDELKLITCHGLRKLPLSIQTSKNIKIIEGKSEWWSQLEWDDDNFMSNLERCC
ncbi:hypothetical protein BC332_20622 [Capsicum chinense]|nr:hypothetical protein BC332_20622 [Capsicum chinense]